MPPGAFLRKRRFLDILVVSRLDLGQISFNLLKNALASRQLGFLATGIAFYDILIRACAVFGRESGLRLKDPFSFTMMLCALFVVKRGH